MYQLLQSNITHTFNLLLSLASHTSVYVIELTCYSGNQAKTKMNNCSFFPILPRNHRNACYIRVFSGTCVRCRHLVALLPYQLSICHRKTALFTLYETKWKMIFSTWLHHRYCHSLPFARFHFSITRRKRQTQVIIYLQTHAAQQCMYYGGTCSKYTSTSNTIPLHSGFRISFRLASFHASVTRLSNRHIAFHFFLLINSIKIH